MRFPSSAPVLACVLGLLLAPVALAGEKCQEDAGVCAGAMEKKLRARGWVGIWVDDGEEGDGFKIDKVVPGSPAEASGLEVGDRVVALNGIPYSRESERELKAIYHEVMKPGNTIVYTVLREDGRVDISIELEEMPAELIERLVGHHILEYHTHSEDEPQGEEN